MQATNLHVITQEQSLLTQMLKQQVEQDDYETIRTLLNSVFEAGAIHEVLDLLTQECEQRGQKAPQWRAIASIIDGAADIACGLH